MTDNKIVFVTGGTGNQGGAVAKKLAHNGFTVKVLTRNPDSVKAQGLLLQNIELVKGDLNQVDTFREHLQDIYGVFSVQSFEKGVNLEIAQGIALAAQALSANVKHFVYSSVAGADENSHVPHMESKLTIENYVRQTGLSFTIIRPTSLYENFLIPQVRKGISNGKLIQPVNGETIMQYVAAEDIGRAALEIFQHPEAFNGRTIPLAAEQLSTLEVAEKFSTVLNKTIVYKKLPALITRLFLGGDLYKMFKWMDKQSKFSTADVDLSRKQFPGWRSLENWIEMNFSAPKTNMQWQ